MISLSDLYNVLSAVVPLYVAMALAYGSVRWWKIFTPDQCSGINRFVALFAFPLVSFQFISSNDPYTMNLRFIAADTLQKLVVLTLLSLFSKLTSHVCGSLEWIITLFSLSTLPNALVMGIPLLNGMYGASSGSLMVQIVALQIIIWCTVMLFLFELRGAKILIRERFPDNTASSIISFRVDSDVVSLDGKEKLETEAEAGEDGKLHVIVRKSSSSHSEIYSRRSRGFSVTPRASSLSNAEIYSLQSSRNPTPRGSSFSRGDLSGNGNGRGSNFSSHVGVDEENGSCPNPTASGLFSPVDAKEEENGSELHKFVWSSSAARPAPMFDKGVSVFKVDVYDEYNGHDEFSFHNRPMHSIRKDDPSSSKLGSNSTSEHHPKSSHVDILKPLSMPPASVMTRLILVMVWRKLIRNPNTYSSLIGLIWSLVSFRWGIQMPAIIARSISILSDGGIGMSMFSLGLFMASQPKIIACGNSVAAFSMAVRFIAGPAVMAAASIAVGLRGTLLHFAIVQAALPQGIVPFIFAKEYNVHANIMSTGVSFGMLIALPIMLVYYILLGL